MLQSRRCQNPRKRNRNRRIRLKRRLLDRESSLGGVVGDGGGVFFFFLGTIDTIPTRPAVGNCLKCDGTNEQGFGSI